MYIMLCELFYCALIHFLHAWSYTKQAMDR